MTKINNSLIEMLPHNFKLTIKDNKIKWVKQTAQELLNNTELSKEDKADLNLSNIGKYGVIETLPHNFKPVAVNKNKFKWVKK